MLWACLRFPRLALDAVGDDDARSDHTPFAVVDGPMQRRFVVLGNAAAQRAGVRNGHALTAAQTLCPQLSTTPRDAGAEHQALESIAAFAYRFSADVALFANDAIVFEIGASLALFGGLAAIERRVRYEAAAFDFAFALTIAPTASGAYTLAAQHDALAVPSLPPFGEALAMLPLTLAGFDDRTLHALEAMGFRRLRDVFRLPRAELARRIGPDALERLDRMRGIAAESLPRYRPPDVFERRIELSFGIESTGALAFPLQRLVRELATFLVARDGGVQRFLVILGHERGAKTRIEIGLLAPRRDAASLFELASARLDRIALPAPVHTLTLRADDLPPLCPLHRDLFEQRRAEALDWPMLAERLRARLGEESLHGLRCVADHRPSRAWRFASLHDAASSIGQRVEPAKPVRPERERLVFNSGQRPFWLLRRPILLRGEPARILAGPERIESGWWDEHDKRRDYYIIETHMGQCAWAFVQAESTSGWTLHGWFA
jgi:protein ImuB